VQTLDLLGVYEEERSNGKVSLLLLDGHGSRYDPNFLKYVNDAKTEWVVCIGVPYGTSLWQVGGSSQQNGAYKMTLTHLNILRETMTNDQRITELSNPIIPKNVSEIGNGKNSPTFTKKYVLSPDNDKKLIFNTGIAAACLGSIVKDA